MLLRRARNVLAPGTVILLYHRIADVRTDPQLLAVSPDNFAQHLEVIRRVAAPKSLLNVADSIKSNNRLSRGVVLTFDDGTSDNLHNAKPLLEKYDVPATVFVSTGYIDSPQEFWWDELERTLLLPGQVPDTLRITTRQTSLEWVLSNAALYTDADFESQKNWNVLTNGAGVRQQIYLQLCDLMRLSDRAERASIVEQLCKWANGNRSRQGYLALTADELKELGSSGLVDIGAHTVHHPVLSEIPVGEQRKEIVESKVRLEEILGRAVKTFAYPYGTPDDYSLSTVNLVKEAGFDCACSNFTGVVQPGAKLFELPRFVVRNWNGDVFERKLESWFHSD